MATHFPEIRLRPTGRRLVRVCTGESCLLKGGHELLAFCQQRLGIRPGETKRAVYLLDRDKAEWRLYCARDRSLPRLGNRKALAERLPGR